MVGALRLTDYHNIEIEALANTFAVPLIRQICETDVACELPPYNVPHIASSLSCSFRVFGADGLTGDLLRRAHGILSLVVG